MGRTTASTEFLPSNPKILKQTQQRLVLWAMPLSEKRINIHERGLSTRGEIWLVANEHPI